MHIQRAFIGCLAVAMACVIGGCEHGGKKKDGGMKKQEMATKSKEKMQAPFGTPDDVRHARMLWKNELADYEEWTAPPNMQGWQPGASPHGKVLRYYINAKAAENPDDPGDGAIIVKENYPSKNAELGPVTVMEKRRGYDPANADWFWVKYGPDGKVMTNKKGVKLAGRVAKGMNKGCIACHRGAAGNDYLFYND